jgi:hypothetical protein
MLATDACPSCSSPLPQPLRWEQLPSGNLDVRLRCPECETCFRITQTPGAMRELDLRQTAGRERLVAAYEEMVTESMEALASSLTAAFARDLLTADDFAPRPDSVRSTPHA